MPNTLENTYKCCFTGYRPNKLPFNVYSLDSKYQEFENALFEKIMELAGNGCRVFYTGMAMGFDIIAAEAVLAVKKAYANPPVKLICVIPFAGQGESFSNFWREKYYAILDSCDEIITLSENYYKGCYQARNIYMVDNSDFVLTWYDGKSGGTRNTLDYAARKLRQIININSSLSKDFAVQTSFEFFEIE